MRTKFLLAAAGLTLIITTLPAQILPTRAAFQQAGSLAAPGSQPATAELAQIPWVTGKAYSATVVTRTLQTFSNGTKVDHTETALVYRDAQGRTRHETNGGRSVSIVDPAAGVEYSYTVPRAPNIPKKGYTKKPLNSGVLTTGVAGNRPQGEAATAQATDKRNEVEENLGTQAINGVPAQGERVTTTIPAGAIGNDRDITIVSERWVSSDLQVLVKSIYSDQRFGTTTYELTNIVRSQPDPALFQVPPGYQLREPSQSGATEFHIRIQPSTKKQEQ